MVRDGCHGELVARRLDGVRRGVKLFVDLEVSRLVVSPGVRSELRGAEFKRGDAAEVEIVFCRGAEEVTLAASSEVVWEVKKSGDYSSDPMMRAEDMALSGGIYSGVPAFDATAIDAEFASDEESFLGMMEVTWKEPDAAGWKSSNTVPVSVYNDVIREGEELPELLMGGVPGVAASARILLADDVAVVNQSGYLDIHGWRINLHRTSGTGSPGAGDLLSWSASGGWIEVIRALAEVINTGAVTDADFTLTGSPGAHPSVSAVVIDNDEEGGENYGTENIHLELTAKTSGIAGNSITYDLDDSEDAYDASGTLSGGVNPRSLVLGDLLPTYEPETALSEAQKTQALANMGLVSSGAAFVAFASDDHVGHATGHGATRAVDKYNEIARHAPPLLVHLGDGLDLGTAGSSAETLEHWARVARIGDFLKSYVIGNHDNGTGDSATDCTTTSLEAYYNLVRDSVTSNPDLVGSHDAAGLGYFHFVKDGVTWVILNLVELQADVAGEGDYGITEAQGIWLHDLIETLSGDVMVCGHLDISTSAEYWARMGTRSREFLQGELTHLAAKDGVVLRGVVSVHEHGINSSGLNRLREVDGVNYFNLIDGRKANGESNIKEELYSDNAAPAWYLGFWDAETRTLSIEGKNGAGDISGVAPEPVEASEQSFNGTSEYRDTGITADGATEFTVRGRFRSLSAAFQLMGGSSAAAGNARFYFGVNTLDDWVLGYDSKQDSGVAADTLTHTWKVTSAGLYVDDVLVVTNTDTIVETNAEIFIGAHNAEGLPGVNYHAAFDMEWASVKKDGFTKFFYPE